MLISFNTVFDFLYRDTSCAFYNAWAQNVCRKLIYIVPFSVEHQVSLSDNDLWSEKV